ncbi:hypothetical protein [Nocardia anaemiae]|uniref:hypothetical protein n=1 Tax=Nocardia anaemiae TaxID=263910 RepID=UPI000AE14113|nr:hypothetical protein [Nocardia anaemiae]
MAISSGRPIFPRGISASNCALVSASNSCSWIGVAIWPGLSTLTRIRRSFRDRTDLSPRERLLAAFDKPESVPPDELTPLCPFIAAAVEITDPGHPARRRARDYKTSVAARFAETARQAGATDPQQLGEQLALLLDGTTARTRALGSETLPTAAAIAAVLIDNALPTEPPPATEN